MFGEVLYTIVHNGLRYEVNTDHLCDFKLWIKVYDGDDMKCNIYSWLLAKNDEMLDTIHHHNGDRSLPSWKDAVGFYWHNVVYDVYSQFFSSEVQRKLDSFFKLKAFW